MTVLRTFIALIVLFSFSLPTAWGDVSKVNNAETTRINWIQNALDSGTRSSKIWQYGWTGIFAASATYEGYNAVEKNKPDEEDERFDATANATTSFLGFGSMVLDPLISHSAAEKLRTMPESNTAEIREKLIAAEKLLRACSKREKRGRSWQTHALSGIVSLLAGVAVACGDNREKDGLIMFASSMVVSEIQIFTMPTTAIDDLNNYKNKHFTKFKKKKSNRFFVNAIPGGLKFMYLF